MTQLHRFPSLRWVQSIIGQPLKVNPAGTAVAVLVSAIAMTATAQPVVTKPLATPSQTVTLPITGVLKDKEQQDFPAAPPVRSGPLPAAVTQALADVAPALRSNRFPTAAVRAIGQGGDAWLGISTT